MAVHPYTGRMVDQFRLDQFIARGAMGMVFKAEDTVIGRTVAIKLISRSEEEGALDGSTANREEARKRLLQEAKAAGRLGHPNIVTVYSYGETTEFVYICMELVRGKTLAELLKEKKNLAAAKAISMFNEILIAMEEAHKEGIVHRDLKPSNIMITDDGKIKVMDFGVAKLPCSSMTVTGAVLGTPYYMSPEQISGEKVDIRSDIFSLGVVLYEVLTGQKPFAGDTSAAVILKILQSDPVPPESISRDVPPPLSAVIRKALSKRKEERFASPEEMLGALRAVSKAMEEESTEEIEATIVASKPLVEDPTVTQTPDSAAVAAGSSSISEPDLTELGAISPVEAVPAHEETEFIDSGVGKVHLREAVAKHEPSEESVQVEGEIEAVEVAKPGSVMKSPGKKPATAASPFGRAVAALSVLAVTLAALGTAYWFHHRGASSPPPVAETSRQAETTPLPPSSPLRESAPPGTPVATVESREASQTPTFHEAKGMEPAPKAPSPEPGGPAVPGPAEAPGIDSALSGLKDLPARSGKEEAVQQAVSESVPAAPVTPKPPTIEELKSARIQSLLAQAREARDKDNLTAPEGSSALNLQKEVFSLDPKNAEALRFVMETVQERIDKSKTALASKDRDKAKVYLGEANDLLQVIPRELSMENKKQISAQRIQISTLLKETSKKPTPATRSVSRRQPPAPVAEPSKSTAGILKESMPPDSAGGTSGPSRQQTQPSGATRKPTILKEEM